MKHIELRNVMNKFQSRVNEDFKRINSTDNVLIPADKFQNIYEPVKGGYNQFLRENVTKTYKRSTVNQLRKINH